jgi:Tol biopolymer transport system component
MIPVRLLLLAAAGLLLAGCSGDGTGPGPGLAAGLGPDVADLAVTGAEPVDVDGTSRLSPDGSRLLHLNRDMCVTGLDGTAKKCVDQEKVDADPRLAQWSPDGTKLVFTDNFFRDFREPDVWVFDVTSGDLRNLTDDGVDDYDIGSPDPDTRVDILPSWSPDGDTIWFARGVEDKTELMAVPADGGDTETLGEIDCVITNMAALAWSAGRVAWTCGVSETEVWLAGHDGGDKKRVLTGEPGEDWMALSFSPDGRWLLADSLSQYLTYAEMAAGAARAVPVDGGDPVAVASGKVAFPSWSPTGHALVYVDLPGSVNVVAEPGGDPKELRTGENISAPDVVRVNWAPGSLLATIDGKTTLLTLE